jgi:hypothetical protein
MNSLISKKIIDEKLSELVKLRDAQVKSEVMQAKRDAEGIRHKAESYVKDMTSVFKKNKIDISAFNALEEKRAKIAIKETEQVRQTMLNSLPAVDESDFGMADGNIAFHFLLPTNTRQYAHDGTVVVEGPDITDLDVLAKSRGEGSGWGAIGVSGWPTVDRYFYFIPPVTGTYRLIANQKFNGFYIVRADDGFFTRKEAWIKLDGKIMVFQYYWQNAEFTVLHESGSDINKSGRYDGYFQASIDVQLGGGDPVFVQLTQKFEALAGGSGSYAEVNFSDGSANAVRQPVLYVNGP